MKDKVDGRWRTIECPEFGSKPDEYCNKLIMNLTTKWAASDCYNHACKIDGDSEDEKKILQADAWAVRELQKQSKGRDRFQPYGRG